MPLSILKNMLSVSRAVLSQKVQISAHLLGVYGSLHNYILHTHSVLLPLGRQATLHISPYKFALKIDLKSIIESKTSPIIDSEFFDRFRTLLKMVRFTKFKKWHKLHQKS